MTKQERNVDLATSRLFWETDEPHQIGAWDSDVEPQKLELNFLSLNHNFTDIYLDNSNSELTLIVFRFPSEVLLYKS